MVRAAFLLLLSLTAAVPALAQSPVTVIAVPPLSTPSKGAKANEDLAIAWEATQLIVTDLRATSELMPLTPKQKDVYSYPEVTAPSFPKWKEAGAKALVTGFVETREDERIYDATPGRLIQVADDHKDSGRVLLVGHNPGLEQLVALLTSGQSGDFRGMPAGGIAVLSMPADAALEPGIARLAAFWWP